MYAAPFLANLHLGYAVVAVSMLPIVLLTAWVFQPRIASVADEAGLVGEGGGAAPGDD